jgi:hypothetical protein
MAVFALSLSLSHLASGEAFGAPADLPWSLELWGARRHPSQIYEVIVASLTLLFLWPTRKYLMDLRTGKIFLYFWHLPAAGLFLKPSGGQRPVAWRLTGCSLPIGLSYVFVYTQSNGSIHKNTLNWFRRKTKSDPTFE